MVGGGDTALEEAIFLTNFASKVTLIHRRDELRGSKIMADRAMANEKITIAWNKTVKQMVGDENGLMEKLILADTQAATTWSCRSAAASSPSATSPTASSSRADRRGRERLRGDQAQRDGHERRGRVGLRRPAGPRVPPGDHGGWDRVHVRD